MQFHLNPHRARPGLLPDVVYHHSYKTSSGIPSRCCDINIVEPLFPAAFAREAAEANDLRTGYFERIKPIGPEYRAKSRN